MRFILEFISALTSAYKS